MIWDILMYFGLMVAPFAHHFSIVSLQKRVEKLEQEINQVKGNNHD